MYNITRQEAADKLWVSTRSVDRYIKSWKIRSKKDWKVVYLHSWDIDNLSWWSNNKQEVIVEAPKNTNYTYTRTTIDNNSKSIDLESNINRSWLDEIYTDLKNQIKEKDNIIKELSIRVWRSEEIAKNSVSLMDFKKSQFLLEESKSSLTQSISELTEEKEKLTWELKYQKTNNIILIISLIVLFAIAGTIFVLTI